MEADHHLSGGVEEEELDWEILSNQELGSPKSPEHFIANHESHISFQQEYFSAAAAAAAVVVVVDDVDDDDDTKATAVALDSQGFQEDGSCQENSGFVSESDSIKWVEPNFESSLRGNAAEIDEADDERTEDFSGNSGISSENSFTGIESVEVVELGSGGDLERELMSKEVVEEEIPAEQVLSQVKAEGGESGGRPWWKIPLGFLKVLVFRVSPVWSISIGVAAMGFFILGRRWYKAKRKPKTWPIRISVEDKKVSQFALRAARLDEKFSVIKHVPIIRSTLLSPDMSPWPMVGLR